MMLSMLFNPFYRLVFFPFSLNLSFMVLIPKVPHVVLVKQFKHIILVNFLYKIITKLIADWLPWVAS